MYCDSGEREIQLGEQLFVFDDEQFMFCPVDVPMCGHIRHTTATQPFVMLSMKIDVQAVHHILLNHTVAFEKSEPSISFMQWQLDETLKMPLSGYCSCMKLQRILLFLHHLFSRKFIIGYSSASKVTN